MNPKLEKYYNFMLDDLMKNVEQGMDNTGQGYFTLFDEYLLKDTPFRLTAFYPSFQLFFKEFESILHDKYGVNYGEVNVIWGLFKIRMNEKYYDSPDGSI